MDKLGNTVFYSIKALYRRVIDIEHKIEVLSPEAIDVQLTDIKIDLKEIRKDLDNEIDRIDLTLKNIDMSISVLESQQKEQQESLVELATLNTDLNNKLNDHIGTLQLQQISK
jgi:ribosomal protein L6P/L9E